MYDFHVAIVFGVNGNARVYSWMSKKNIFTGTGQGGGPDIYQY